MKTRCLWLLPIVWLNAVPLAGQTDTRHIATTLKEEIIPPQVALFELKQYVTSRVAKPPAPRTAEEWTSQAKSIRERLLRDVVYHGWPKEWVDAPPKFEQIGVITGNGYRIRKLRYEIVPGFQSVALLYEPEHLQGKVPAILNVHGHVGDIGKAIAYKQKQCITFARHGVMSLSLEWYAFGELSRPGNEHLSGAYLDLVGSHELGMFYLLMRKGLDYLYEHPNTDRTRLGMTGLSGGGWQTIFLSSLDERVRVSIPVAGFSSIISRTVANGYGDLGDLEQSPTDFFVGIDYPHLVALMAPRPTMLIYNAEDDCCFRASVTKPFVLDPIRPIFSLYGKEDQPAWHENRDPGTHNYELDNRMQAYRFFCRQFGIPVIESEGDAAAEMKSYADLVVGIPEDNLTFLELARKLAGQLQRQPTPSTKEEEEQARARLRTIIRYHPAKIDHSWVVAISKHTGIQTRSHAFFLNDGLPATGVWLKAIESSDRGPVTIVLDDRGKASATTEVAKRVEQGDRVLALDLAFTGAAWKGEDIWAYQQMLYAIGNRPLGLEVAQLIEIARWAKEQAGASKVRLESNGIRSQTASLIAAAIEPGLFSDIVVRSGMPSFSYALEKPVRYEDAPDLFCLDLFKETDLDRLAILARPATVQNLKAE